jgi:glycosyltransferase involved in cell wall biosynthesis
VSTTPLSVIVITHNEERHIDACLESVAWANDIVVLDSESTDRTVPLASARTPKVHVLPWMGYARMKQAALAFTVNEWVLWLDADERVGAELAAEIRSVLAAPPGETAGYEVARRAFFIGKWIRHCGWYPGYVVRLFRKSRGSFNDARVHEGLALTGPSSRLRNDLLHFTDETLYHYFDKFNRYTTLAAEEILTRGGSFSLYDLLVRPPFLFMKMYFLKGGFLDGVHGLVLSLASAAYVFCKYAKCWDLARAQSARAMDGN